MTVNRPGAVGALYRHLQAQPAFATQPARTALARRLRAALLKQWTLVGIPVVLGAVAALAGVEREAGVEAGERIIWYVGRATGRAEGSWMG